MKNLKIIVVFILIVFFATPYLLGFLSLASSESSDFSRSKQKVRVEQVDFDGEAEMFPVEEINQALQEVTKVRKKSKTSSIKYQTKKYFSKINEIDITLETYNASLEQAQVFQSFYNDQISIFVQEINNLKQYSNLTYKQALGTINAKKIMRRLENLRIHRAYLKKMLEHEFLMKNAIDSLFSHRRNLEAHYHMLAFSGQVNIGAMLNQIDNFLKKEIPDVKDLVLGIEFDESLEEVWEEEFPQKKNLKLNQGDGKTTLTCKIALLAVVFFILVILYFVFFKSNY